MSKRLCKICKIKPPSLNFQWLIGPSSIYVAKQQLNIRTKWNHQKKKILTFQWLCLIVYLYKQFLRLGQNLPLSYSLLCSWQTEPCLLCVIKIKQWVCFRLFLIKLCVVCYLQSEPLHFWVTHFRFYLRVFVLMCFAYYFHSCFYQLCCFYLLLIV